MITVGVLCVYPALYLVLLPLFRASEFSSVYHVRCPIKRTYTGLTKKVDENLLDIFGGFACDHSMGAIYDAWVGRRVHAREERKC